MVRVYLTGKKKSGSISEQVLQILEMRTFMGLSHDTCWGLIGSACSVM